MAEKFAQAAGTTAKASKAARWSAAIMTGVRFLLPLAVARVDLDPRDLLERAGRPVELDVELHVAHSPLEIAPRPYLFVVEAGKADVSRIAEQPPRFVAGHSDLQP